MTWRWTKKGAGYYAKFTEAEKANMSVMPAAYWEAKYNGFVGEWQAYRREVERLKQLCLKLKEENQILMGKLYRLENPGSWDEFALERMQKQRQDNHDAD